jgi:hypothetical protein
VTEPTRRLIPENVIPGKRLGRHVYHDPRSLNYLVEETTTVVSKNWPRRIPVLDQGEVGSCTGNATVHALGCDPNYATLATKVKAGLRLDEPEAQRIYSAAETIDGDGPFPPNDNGSYGLSVAKAAKNAGLISGYTHATSLNAMCSALQRGPVIIGINWYDSFDTPNPSSGRVEISSNAVIRGGHEVCVNWIDVKNRLFVATNSWGVGWGIKGTFEFSWDTMTTLFGEQGDCTQFVPLTAAQAAQHGGHRSVWSRIRGWL